MKHQNLTRVKGKNTMKILKITAVSAMLLLSACSILPKSEPQTRYNLPALAMTPNPVQKNTALYLAVPQANRLINSHYILVQPEGTEIQIYKGSQWADSAPVLLRDRLVQALNDARLFNAISVDAAINTPWALQGYLQHFEAQYKNGQPVVNLHYEAQLINRQNSSIINSQRFVINQATTDTSVEAVITAFGLAGDQLSLQLLEWLGGMNLSIAK